MKSGNKAALGILILEEEQVATDEQEGQVFDLPELPMAEQLTLAYVNKIRAENGQDPIQIMPAAHKGDPYWCTIAVALRWGGEAKKDAISVTAAGIEYNGRHYPHTPESLAFMNGFDNSARPDLTHGQSVPDVQRQIQTGVIKKNAPMPRDAA